MATLFDMFPDIHHDDVERTVEEYGYAGAVETLLGFSIEHEDVSTLHVTS